MRKLLRFAAFLPVLACAQQIGVYLSFDAAPSRASLAELQREALAVLKPTGLDIGWRLASQSRGDEAFGRVVVLRFRGSCRAGAATDELAPFGQVRRLAASNLEEGHGTVECDRVKASLDRAAGSERMVGRALGRVVAHELRHMLTHTASHTREGIARAVQTVRDLTAEGARLEGAR